MFKKSLIAESTAALLMVTAPAQEAKTVIAVASKGDGRRHAEDGAVGRTGAN